jgi:outer membrane protein OmpA-like peptidoglycan-associated protein
MRKLALVALVLFAAGCAKPWPDVEPVKTGPLAQKDSEWRVTDHVVVIADASGTMTREALLPEARALAQSFLAGMPSPSARAKGSGPYEVSLIGFGGSGRLATTHNTIDAMDDVPEGQVRHRDQLHWQAANLHPLPTPTGGETPIADVLGEAGDVLQGERGQAAVVLISDGIADDPAAALESGRALVAGHPDGVCIHTIHMGENAEGRSLLGQLAGLSSNGCGSARDAASVRSAAAVQDLERDVFVAAAPAPRELPPVSSSPCDTRIVLRGVQFELDSAALSPVSEPVLDIAVDQLKECSDLHLAVEGHTCDLGSDAYNFGLSERRAASVREYLVAHGVAAERLKTRGLGESNPVSPNDGEEGRAQNRRVELVPD